MLLNYTYKDANNLVRPEKGLYLILFVKSSSQKARKGRLVTCSSATVAIAPYVTRNFVADRPIGPLDPL